MEKNQSLDRTLDVLECFSTSRPKIGLSDLTRATFYIAAVVGLIGYVQSYLYGWKSGD